MSSLKTQFITHNPFSTLLEMQFGGVLKSEVGVSVMGADHGRATVQSLSL